MLSLNHAVQEKETFTVVNAFDNRWHRQLSEGNPHPYGTEHKYDYKAPAGCSGEVTGGVARD